MNTKSTPRYIGALEAIKQTFHLTDEELATILGKRRDTINKWRQDKAKPNAKTLKRIFHLSHAVSLWKQSGFAMEKTQLHQPILGQDSLYDVLRRDPIDPETLAFIGSGFELLKKPTPIMDFRIRQD